jgi:ribosomal protein L16/L10AE
MKLFVRFTLPCTAKSKNARMGKGKGGVSSFVSRINELSPLFLLRNVNYICASRGAHDVSTKLPVHVLALKRDLVNKLVYSRSVVDKRKDLGTKVTKKRKGK